MIKLGDMENNDSKFIPLQMAHYDDSEYSDLEKKKFYINSFIETKIVEIRVVCHSQQWEEDFCFFFPLNQFSLYHSSYG